MFAMYASHYIIGLSSEDVIYCHLPLYHSSGLFVLFVWVMIGYKIIEKVG